MPSSVAKQAGTQGCQMACINLLKKENTVAPIEVIYVVFFTTQKSTTTGRHFVFFRFLFLIKTSSKFRNLELHRKCSFRRLRSSQESHQNTGTILEKNSKQKSYFS